MKVSIVATYLRFQKWNYVHIEKLDRFSVDLIFIGNAAAVVKNCGMHMFEWGLGIKSGWQDINYSLEEIPRFCTF